MMKPFYSKKGKKIIIVYFQKKKKLTKTLPKAEILLKNWDTLKTLLNSKEKKDM